MPWTTGLSSPVLSTVVVDQLNSYRPCMTHEHERDREYVPHTGVWRNFQTIMKPSSHFHFSCTLLGWSDSCSCRPAGLAGYLRRESRINSMDIYGRWHCRATQLFRVCHKQHPDARLDLTWCRNMTGLYLGYTNCSRISGMLPLRLLLKFAETLQSPICSRKL